MTSKIYLVFLAALVLSGMQSVHAQELNAPQYSLEMGGDLRSLAFSPDGKLLATTSGTKTTIWLWNTATGKLVTKLSTGKDPGNYVGESNYLLIMPRVGYTQMNFSPDGRFLAVFSQVTKDVRLWEVQTGKLYLTLTGIRYMMSVAFSPDGRLLALALGDQGLKLIDVGSGQLLTAKWDLKNVASVNGADFSKDGGTVVLAIASTKDARSGFYFVDTSSGNIKATILPPGSRDTWGQVNRDGNSLATFEEGGGDIKFWDMTTGQLKSTIAGKRSKISNISMSLDGRTLAITTKEGKVELWNSEASDPKIVLQTQDEKLKYAVFYPGDKDLLTVSARGLKVWDATTGVLKQSLQSSREPFGFSPSGQLLATANKGGGAQIWQIQR